MEDNNKKRYKRSISLDLGFWEILLICFTIVTVVSMFTGHFDKLIQAFK